MVVNWSLEFLNGPLKGDTVNISDGMVIGRQDDCDISVLDGHLSRRHLIFRLEQNTLLAEDLGSTNGSFLNGSKFSRSELNADDVIRLDTLEIKVLKQEIKSGDDVELAEYTEAPHITGHYLDKETLELRSLTQSVPQETNYKPATNASSEKTQVVADKPEPIKPIEEKNVSYRPERLEKVETLEDDKGALNVTGSIPTEEKSKPRANDVTQVSTAVTPPEVPAQSKKSEQEQEAPKKVVKETTEEKQQSEEKQKQQAPASKPEPVISDPIVSKPEISEPVAEKKPDPKPEVKSEKPVQSKPAEAVKQAERVAESKTESKPVTRSKNIPWWEDQGMGPEGTRLVDTRNVMAKSPSEFVVEESIMAALDGAALIGITPPFTNMIYKLKDGQNNVGKTADNDIAIEEATISSTHAQVIAMNGSWKLVNLLSANGTFVNEQKIQSAFLNNGDNIRVGGVTLRFVAPRGYKPPSQAQATAGNGKKPVKVFVAAFIVTAIVLGVVLAFVL